MFVCQLKYHSVMYLVITNYYPAQKSHRKPECLGITKLEYWHAPKEEVLTDSQHWHPRSVISGWFLTRLLTRYSIWFKVGLNNYLKEPSSTQYSVLIYLQMYNKTIGYCLTVPFSKK